MTGFHLLLFKHHEADCFIFFPEILLLSVGIKLKGKTREGEKLLVEDVGRGNRTAHTSAGRRRPEDGVWVLTYIAVNPKLIHGGSRPLPSLVSFYDSINVCHLISHRRNARIHRLRY